MKYKSGSRKVTNYRKAAPFTTTIMELLHALSDLTKDDKIVLSVFKSIFESHNVRLAHSLAPLRLVDTIAPSRTDAGRTSAKRHSVWTQLCKR
jgi:hypothetical protein